MNTDRIPGFAICARCGGRNRLGGCFRCGMLMCNDCRGGGECILCYRDDLRARSRAERNRRWRAVGHGAGVAACIAATGLAGVGAAMIPDPPGMMCCQGRSGVEARSAVEARREGRPACPSLAEARQEGRLAANGWGEPLRFGCVKLPHSFAALMP